MTRQLKLACAVSAAVAAAGLLVAATATGPVGDRTPAPVLEIKRSLPNGRTDVIK